MVLKDDVRARFAPIAANYVTSSFHASPERLDEIIDLAQPRAGEVTLDTATGTGNTALALAPHLRHVTGPDLTPEMLDEARKLASKRRLTTWSGSSATRRSWISRLHPSISTRPGRLLPSAKSQTALTDAAPLYCYTGDRPCFGDRFGRG